MSDLVTRALEVNAANLALGCQRFAIEDAVLVLNRETPQIYDANHVSNVTASSLAAIDRLLAAVEGQYEGIDHRRFDVDYRTPPEFVARLALEGYERDDALILLLEGDLEGTAQVHEIRAVESESDWNAYAALHAIDWRNGMERRKEPEQPEVRDSMIVANRAKQPPVQNWLAYIDGSAVAYFNSWEGTDGMGQVENLFTHPDFRHRGLARALIHHCVTDSRRKGAGPVVIAADPSDTPKQMYAALGFRPLAVCSHYLKKLTPTA